jgi:nucleoside-diphosphate-sugar epimerase
MHAIVTGAGGFVGRALGAALGSGYVQLAMGSPDWDARLRAARLEGATIFHLAARVHRHGDADEAAFDRDNAGKTRSLAQEAVRQRARRIVFMSTIKVHGEETRGRPFSHGDVPAPQDAYGRSKLAAEHALAETAGAGGIAWVVVRSPLVLGPHPAGNLASLVRVADTPWPLPFASIENRRSFVHVGDLARLLVACGEHAQAPGRTFLAAHPVPWSTPMLVSVLRRALGRPARLFAVAPGLLERAAALAGRGELARRLTRSLEVDASLAGELLGWSAATGLEEAAADVARSWRSRAA